MFFFIPTQKVLIKFRKICDASWVTPGNFPILDGDPASLWWELESRVSTKLPEDGDGAGPWLFFLLRL